LLFWIGEPLFAALVLGGEGSLWQELLNPEPRALAARVFALVASLAICVLLDRYQQLRREGRLFYQAVEHAPDGVQLVDLQGRILYSNLAVEEIYGYSADELMGRAVSEMNADSLIAEQVIIPSIKCTGRWAGEVIVKHKSGKTFPIWLTTSMLLDEAGQPRVMLGIIRDITDRKRAETALADYAARLAHEQRVKGCFEPSGRHRLHQAIFGTLRVT
jgi:PAS domain S-box-containing protein